MDGDWKEWSRYVLKELERLDSCYETLDLKVDKVTLDTSVLKVKMALIGFFAGCIPAVIGVVAMWLSTGGG